MERSPQDLSEAILSSLAPCEGIVKLCHRLLVHNYVSLFQVSLVENYWYIFVRKSHKYWYIFHVVRFQHGIEDYLFISHKQIISTAKFLITARAFN